MRLVNYEIQCAMGKGPELERATRRVGGKVTKVSLANGNGLAADANGGQRYQKGHPRKHFGDEGYVQVFKLYDGGKRTVRQVAKKLGRNPTSVHNVLRLAGDRAKVVAKQVSYHKPRQLKW